MAPKQSKTRAPKSAPPPAVSPAARPKAGGKLAAVLAGLVLLFLLGQTWFSWRQKAAEDINLVRQGNTILRGLEDGHLMGALALGNDGDSNLYVLDVINSDEARLQKFSPDNIFIARYKPANSLQALTGCRELAVGKGGELAVLKQNGTVFLIDKKMRFKASFDAGTGTSGGIAIDSKGRIFVSSVDGHKIRIFDEAGRRLSEFGGPGTKSGDLSFPMRLRFLADDRLVVVESTPTGAGMKVFTPDLKVERSFPLKDVQTGPYNLLGVNADGLAVSNDTTGPEGVIVYDVLKGKRVGSCKGTTSGQVFQFVGAVGADPYSKAIYVGTVEGYTKGVIGSGK